MAEQIQGTGRQIPTTEQIREELERVRFRMSFAATLRKFISALIVISASAVLIAVLFLPALRIYGHSMNDTLEDGDIVISVKGSNFETGDIIAFYYNSKVLVKRVIGQPDDWIYIDEEGNVYVNQSMIDEPYLKSKSFGETNIALPYKVPESRIFVLGDSRDVSIDSRNTSVGCVAEEQVVGKIVFRIWPLNKFGAL